MSDAPQPSLIIMQAVIGGIFTMLGMFLITPLISWNINPQVLAIAVGIICFYQGLTQLAAAFLTVVKKE